MESMLTSLLVGDPNTYPYLSFDSRYLSTGENEENGGIRMAFESQIHFSKNYSRQAKKNKTTK